MRLKPFADARENAVEALMLLVVILSAVAGMFFYVGGMTTASAEIVGMMVVSSVPGKRIANIADTLSRIVG
jgi:hypothetical protein